MTSYDEADRIQTSGTTTFQHDANGKLTQVSNAGINTSYVYNYDNMLKQVSTPLKTYQYEYDPLLNRISAKEGSQEKFWVVNPANSLPQPIVRTDSSGIVLDYYIFGLGLIGRINSLGQDYYYHFDGSANTTVVTNSNGNRVNFYSYGAYGELLSSQESFFNPFRFTGKHSVIDDENGLLYMRARYYIPEIGRFTTMDPIGLAGGINKYVYVENNPISWTDPLGLCKNTFNYWGSFWGSFWGQVNAEMQSGDWRYEALDILGYGIVTLIDTWATPEAANHQKIFTLASTAWDLSGSGILKGLSKGKNVRLLEIHEHPFGFSDNF